MPRAHRFVPYYRLWDPDANKGEGRYVQGHTDLCDENPDPGWPMHMDEIIMKCSSVLAWPVTLCLLHVLLVRTRSRRVCVCVRVRARVCVAW